MKTVISDTDGFRHIIELREVVKPEGYTQIRFLTEWDHARRDGSAQVQHEIILSPIQLKNLKDLL